MDYYCERPNLPLGQFTTIVSFSLVQRLPMLVHRLQVQKILMTIPCRSSGILWLWEINKINRVFHSRLEEVPADRYLHVSLYEAYYVYYYASAFLPYDIFLYPCTPDNAKDKFRKSF